MTASQSSSHHSQFDDNSVLSDVSHFEEIGLDDSTTSDVLHARDVQVKPAASKPYTPGYPSDLRAQQRNGAVRQLTGSGNVAQKFRPQRDMTPIAGGHARSEFPSLRNHVRSATGRSASASASSDGPLSPVSFRRLAAESTASLPLPGRHRSPSPGLTLYPRDPNQLMRPRRSSWQSNRERKSILELERECDDDDDDDDIPDGLILDNVPISPRPTRDRPRSRPASASPSPNRLPKDRRSVGNGTPPVAQAQGCLRSPSWKSETALAEAIGRAESLPQHVPTPIKGRAKSWNVAMAGLSAEAKALTEKLEEHCDEVLQQDPQDQRQQLRRLSPDKRPATWDSSRRSLDQLYWEPKPKQKLQLPDLPPLRRTNVMIDPLPISKEKEAVLSRTRPSWLPPKDPAEERRHLKEYQRMMAMSADSDRRREAQRSASSAFRDSTADNLMRMWEDDILPRWSDAIRERRTRELWWKGVAPRSRGAVWSRALSNELGLSETSYEAALKRARDAEERIKEDKGDAEDARRAVWFKAIRKDVGENTWPDLRIFQDGGPLHGSLINVLSAYAMYRADIGYVAGCNSIAALLLLNLPNATDAFIALANVLNRPIPLSFYAGDPGAKTSAYNIVLQTLKTKSPNLHDHLTRVIPDADPELYLADVFTGLFTGSLAIDEAARLWDVYVFEGDAILVRAAVALLIREEIAILGTQSVDEVRTVLGVDSASKRQKKAVGDVGAEDRWMKMVRDAGRL